MRDLLRYQKEYVLEHSISWGKNALAIGAVVAGASIITAPVAKEVAIEHASIDTDVAEAPAEMRFTGNGTSSLQTGTPGTFYAPVNQDGVGMTAELKDVPGGGSGSIRDLLSPQFVNVVTNLYHDPERSVDVYVDLLKKDAQEKGNLFFGLGMLGLSGMALGPLALRKDWREAIKQHQKTTAAIGVGLFAASLAVSNNGADSLRANWAETSPHPEKSYPIRGLEGTFLEGTVASNQLLQVATNEAVPSFKKNVDRQEAATSEFVEAAQRSFLLQRGKMPGPRDGEVVEISASDIHANQAMIEVMSFMRDAWAQDWGNGTIRTILLPGDLTTNGTAPEGVFINDIAEIGKGPDDKDTPVVGVSGDHETPVSVEQMVGAGITNPDLHTVTVDGSTYLGANDTAQKDVGGSKTGQHIGGINEQELGQEVRELADTENPDTVMLHEGYAVMSFLGIDKLLGITDKNTMTTFLGENGPHNVYLTRYRNDGIPNIPTKDILFGHWHKLMPVRTIWNEEWVDANTATITWTTVQELNTAGGAIGNPTVNKFSLPWYPPLQDAGIRLTFKNAETGLTTGYRDYTYDPNGNLTIGPRVDVGLPGGEPGTAHFTKGQDGTLKLKRLVLADGLPTDLTREPVLQP
jgi:hypothetical protein